jgi:phage protein U
MSEVMMQVGDFQFSLGTAAYQDLQRATEYRWASQERLGAREALQFTGPGSETIDLRGVIYPFHRGGDGQVDQMRAAAAAGEPLMVVAGDGSVMGKWVIASIREDQKIFARKGAPRRVEFTMRMRRYEDADT